MTAILGGGIAGLSSAFYALENPKIGPLLLLEASERLGGWIRTETSASGALFEKGPRTIRPAGKAGKNTLRLIDDLDLTKHLLPIPSNHATTKNRLIYVDNKLHQLPNSLIHLLTIRSPFKRPLCTVALNDLLAKKGESSDESMYSFAERRFGQDVADYLISPMLCGICAGDAKKISANFLMKGLMDMEQKHRSVVKGMLIESFRGKSKKNDKSGQNEKHGGDEDLAGSAKRAQEERWSVWSLHGGLQQIPEAIATRLQAQDVNIQLKAEVKNITFTSNSVELDVNGEVHKCDRVISALSAAKLGRILERQHPQLSRELTAIPTVTVAVINFEFPGKVLPMEAFGLLVPPNQRIPILGIIFDSCVSPRESSTVLTVMMGGAWFDEYFGDDPSQVSMESLALNHLRKILGINIDPLNSHFQILRDSIPQYIVGHEERIKRIRNYINSHKIPLTLCGWSYQGVGLNDVILSAKQAVYDIS